MFWYAVVHVLVKLGFYRPYLWVCLRLIRRAAWENEG